ncbi:MAG: hypothetical protein MUP70_16990 [Candidatus Aminicenantes bacterium]|nr:hypothetical protein [Candidatus Aminicenantes bacterium]
MHKGVTMKEQFNVHIFLGILIIAMISVGYQVQAQDADLSFDAGIWVEKWVGIWNSYDLDQVDELFLQENRLTYFSSEKEDVIIGIDAVRDHHRGFGFVPGGKDQPNKLWVEDLHSEDFDSSAIVTGIWYFQRPDGSKQRGPVTIFYIQQGDGFRIAHMNFSNYPEEKKEEKES